MKGFKGGSENGQVYSGIINEHLKFIEQKCFRSLQGKSNRSNDIELENDALKLFNRVVDKLREDDHKILRNFQGRAKLTTYLTTIISFQAIDLIRQRRGRNQERERAKKAGKSAELIYNLVFKEERGERDAYGELKISEDFEGSYEEFSELVSTIRGKSAKVLDLSSGDLPVKQGFRLKDKDSFEIPDRMADPELIYLKENRQARIQKVVAEVVAGLSGEQQMLLRMRYPKSYSKQPMQINEIADILNLSKKAVYNRLERILKKCRKKFNKEVVNELL
jgi:RNA polymerase sigma factor (sigma-70 family)